MPPVTVINHFVIKSGLMEAFIEAQQHFAASMIKEKNGLIGGRMYKSTDGKLAVLISQFQSVKAFEALRKTDIFTNHISKLRELIETSSPAFYEEAYTTGAFQ